MNSSSVDGNVSSPGDQQHSLISSLFKNFIVTGLCIAINYINCTLVHTFRKHEVFSLNPRYIMFIHLVVNDMMQLFLSAFLYVISFALHTISVPFCIILLIIAILTTFNTPLNLSCMAVECYLAVCMPLRHGQICTVKRTYVVISLIWVTSTISIMPDVFILLATEPLHFFHTQVLCARDNIFRRSYSLKKRDASHIVCLVLVWITLFYSYLMILFAAKVADKDLKKTRNTLLLHGLQLLLCMVTYVRPMFEKILLYIFPMHYQTVRFICYVIVQILPRFISPIVYGLRDKTFRRYLIRYLLCKEGMNNQAEIK